MYNPQSLIIILVAIALTVIAPSLSFQGAVAATNGQKGPNGRADPSSSSAKGGNGGTGNSPNSGDSNNGNGGAGGQATVRSTANGGNGGTDNILNSGFSILVMEEMVALDIMLQYIAVSQN